MKDRDLGRRETRLCGHREFYGPIKKDTGCRQTDPLRPVIPHSMEGVEQGPGREPSCQDRIVILGRGEVSGTSLSDPKCDRSTPAQDEVTRTQSLSLTYWHEKLGNTAFITRGRAPPENSEVILLTAKEESR